MMVPFKLSNMFPLKTIVKKNTEMRKCSQYSIKWESRDIKRMDNKYQFEKHTCHYLYLHV